MDAKKGSFNEKFAVRKLPVICYFTFWINNKLLLTFVKSNRKMKYLGIIYPNVHIHLRKWYIDATNMYNIGFPVILGSYTNSRSLTSTETILTCIV